MHAQKAYNISLRFEAKIVELAKEKKSYFYVSRVGYSSGGNLGNWKKFVVNFLITNKPMEPIREDLKGDLYIV